MIGSRIVILCLGVTYPLKVQQNDPFIGVTSDHGEPQTVTLQFITVANVQL